MSCTKHLNQKIKGIKCLNCLDEIWNKHVHDFKYCSCGKVIIDGDREYLRYGGDFTKIKEIDIKIKTKSK